MLEFKSGTIEAEKAAEERLNIHNYLNELAIYAEKQEQDDKDTVKMMTIHSAKGQEFPFVFVPFFNEHILPTRHAVNPAAIEEERRIAYVAFTRAEKQLFISESDGSEIEHYLLPSRFLLEIKQDCLAIDGVVSANFWDESKAKIESTIANQNLAAEGAKKTLTPSLNIGDFVQHYQFGLGQVIEVRQNSVTVLFETGEKRNLVPKSLIQLDEDLLVNTEFYETRISQIKSDGSYAGKNIGKFYFPPAA